jgi:hypothetical protein
MAMTRQTAVARAIAERTGAVLNRLFGPTLVSIRAVGASTALSLASLLLTGTATNGIVPGLAWIGAAFDRASVYFHANITWPLAEVIPAGDSLRLNILAMTLSACLALTVASKARRLPIAASLTALIIWYAVVTYLGQPLVILLWAIPAVAFGVLADFVAITVLRRLVAFQSNSVSLIKIGIAAAGQVALAFALLFGPAASLHLLSTFIEGRSSDITPVTWVIGFLAVAFAISAAANIFTAFVVLAYFIVTLVFLIHTMLWPVLERPLYQLATFGLFRTIPRRVALFTVGFSAISAGVWGVNGTLAAAFRLISST